ncbi:hypothetical protein D3C72_2297740 [compost metagenome]
MFPGSEVSPERLKRVDADHLGKRERFVRLVQAPRFLAYSGLQQLGVYGVAGSQASVLKSFFNASFIP